MSWRWQPVYVKEGEDCVFSLCAVYLDDEGRVESWDENPISAPIGNDQEDLSAEIMHMIVAAYSWMPVPHESLRVGIVLQRRITMAQREALAKMVENMALNLTAALPSVKGTTENGDV